MKATTSGETPNTQRKRKRRSRRKDGRKRFVEAAKRPTSPYIHQLDIKDDDSKAHPRDPHRLAGQVLNKLARVDGKWAWRHWYGQIFAWVKGRYAPLQEDVLRAHVTGALKGHFHDRVMEGLDKNATAVTTNLQSAVLNAMKSVVMVDAESLPVWLDEREDSPPVFAFRNGLMEIDKALGGDLVLTSLDPRWFSRVCFPFSLQLDASCPKWENFLNQVLPAPEDRALVQEIFGYCLVPDTRYHKFFLLIGEGGNGKGVVLSVLTELLGEENVSSVPLEDFADKFGLESTVDKLANIVHETEANKKLPEGTLKSYVSAERITVNRKHLKDMQVKPSARLLVATNEMPQFKDQSEGMARRFVPLRFPVSIRPEQRDPDLLSKLLPELPGIFLWALEGLRRLRARNGFDLPESSQALIEEARPERPTSDEFLTQLCEPDPLGWMATEELYVAYRNWCSSMARPVDRKAMFCSRIEGVVGGTRKQREGSNPRRWGYAGLRLKAGALAD
jgi:putative DNA primase/helicase